MRRRVRTVVRPGQAVSALRGTPAVHPARRPGGTGRMPVAVPAPPVELFDDRRERWRTVPRTRFANQFVSFSLLSRPSGFYFFFFFILRTQSATITSCLLTWEIRELTRHLKCRRMFHIILRRESNIVIDSKSCQTAFKMLV